MKSLHLTITGGVQGVGYRGWLEREARARGLAGWVRNRSDGSVEALIAGDDIVVDALALLCEKGPPGARVRSVKPAEHSAPLAEGFVILPTR